MLGCRVPVLVWRVTPHFHVRVHVLDHGEMLHVWMYGYLCSLMEWMHHTWTPVRSGTGVDTLEIPGLVPLVWTENHILCRHIYRYIYSHRWSMDESNSEIVSGVSWEKGPGVQNPVFLTDRLRSISHEIQELMWTNLIDYST